ncbi:unnamed protein product [Pylaiella littoralis]
MVTSRLAPKKEPVVIDFGSAFIRCGFAGESRPIHVVPSPVAGNGHGDNRRNNSSSAWAGGSGSGSGLTRSKEEWVEVLTGVLSRLYTESLQCRPRERRVVLCESMVSPRPLREAIAHVLFLYLQVPSLHMCAGPAPALYCTGLDTGMVLDIGRSEAHVVAVYRGASLTSSYTDAPLGCLAVQERVGELLAEAEKEKEGEGEAEERRPLTSRELEDVVVRSCLVPVGGVPSADQVSPMEFMFAGRRRVTSNETVRTAAVEQALFQGDEEGRTLATLVLDCLKRCPLDCRTALAQNVVVAGGGALLPGLCARLAEEVEALAAAAAPGAGNPEGYAWARAVVLGDRYHHNHQGGGRGGGLCVVRVPVRRDQLLWTGASIMASLPRIADRSLTSEQYLAPMRRGGAGDGCRIGCRCHQWIGFFRQQQ